MHRPPNLFVPRVILKHRTRILFDYALVRPPTGRLGEDPEKVHVGIDETGSMVGDEYENARRG